MGKYKDERVKKLIADLRETVEVSKQALKVAKKELAEARQRSAELYEAMLGLENNLTDDQRL